MNRYMVLLILWLCCPTFWMSGQQQQPLSFRSQLLCIDNNEVCVIGDLDGDGNGELITGKRVWAHLGKDPGADEPAVIYRYVWDQEHQSFHRQVINTGEASTGLFIRAADLNQDQKMDLVVAGRTGTYILWQQ